MLAELGVDAAVHGAHVQQPLGGPEADLFPNGLVLLGVPLQVPKASRVHVKFGEEGEAVREREPIIHPQTAESIRSALLFALYVMHAASPPHAFTDHLRTTEVFISFIAGTTEEGFSVVDFPRCQESRDYI